MFFHCDMVYVLSHSIFDGLIKHVVDVANRPILQFGTLSLSNTGPTILYLGLPLSELG